MDDMDILSNLCIYDERNPNNFNDILDDYELEDHCFCDNCFYGRDKLAREILKLKGDTR